MTPLDGLAGALTLQLAAFDSRPVVPTGALGLLFETLDARLARIEEAVRARQPAQARRPASATALGLNATARRLRRSKATIARWVAEGLIETVPWPGKRSKYLIPIAEVERIERKGIERPAPPEPKPRRRRGARNVATEREAAVARILAHPVE